MKRVISVILTLAMLLSLVAVIPVFSSSAAEAEYEHTLGGYNVGTKAYKFDGTVIWEAFSGTGARATTPYYWAKDHYLNPVDPVTVKTGTTSDVLTIDGVIEDGEWGTPSVSISSKDAVEFKVGGSTDFNYLYPNAENSFFSYVNNADGLAVKDGTLDNEEYTLYYEGMKYDVYFMWDEEYLYIAAKVYDPDGHSQKVVPGADADGSNVSLDSTWNGDAFQFRIDGEGPNSVSNGGSYDAAQNSPSTFDIPEGGLATGSALTEGQYAGDYDPMTGEAYTESYYTYPWASTVKMFSNEVKTDVCNFTISYSSSKNGFTAVHDAAKRYNPHTFEHQSDGATILTYVAYDGASLSFYNSGSYKNTSWTVMLPSQDMVYATVTPQGTGYVYEEANSSGRGTQTYDHKTTDYEIAVPWSYINLQSGTEIAPGLELGVALGLLNAKSGSEYNATLEWGNGIFNQRMSAMPQTCGGSNSLILSETSYKDHVACTHEFSDPTCEQPYTCTLCGYQKGYKAGHKYNTYEEVLPTDSEAGYTKAECIVCHDKVTRELASTHRSIKSSFSRTETTHDNIYDNFSVGYSTLWINRTYIVNEDGEIETKKTTDSQGNEIDAGETIRTVEDNKVKMSFWAAGAKKPYCTLTKDDSDLITNPFGYAVLDLTSIDQTGTYFLQSTGSPSYTYKADIYLEGVYDCDWEEGVETVNNVNHGSEGYLDSMYFWFGGEGEMDYQAGLYEVKGEWYFAIVKNSANLVRDYINNDLIDDVPTGKDGLEEFRRQAIVFNKATDAQVQFDAWHEVVFFFDKDANVASLYWDGTLVAGAYDESFISGKTGTEGNSMFRPFNMQLYMTDIEIGASSLASKYVEGTGTGTPDPDPAPTYTVSVNGAVIGEYEEGATVTVTADVADGYSFDGWQGDVAFADATAAQTTFTMPAKAVEVTYTTTEIPATKYEVSVNGTVIGEYEEGATVTVTATVEDGYKFDGWQGDVAFADATAAETTFTMPANAVAVTYTTSVIKYAVTVNGTAIGEYAPGETVTVTATVEDGYTFDGWQGDVAFADATATETTFTMPAGAVEVTYTTTKAPVQGDVDGNGSVNVADVYALKTALIGRGEYDAKYDINGDGKINLVDMFALKKMLLA